MPSKGSHSGLTRRRLLGRSVLAGAALAAPSIVMGAQPTFAQSLSTSAFGKAKIDWQQFKGEDITVAVIPAASEMAIFRTRGGARQLCGCGKRCRVIAVDRREADHALEQRLGEGTRYSPPKERMIYLDRVRASAPSRRRSSVVGQTTTMPQVSLRQLPRSASKFRRRCSAAPMR